MSIHAKSPAGDAVKAAQDISHQVGEVVKEGAAKALDSVKSAATQAQQRAGEQLEEWSDDISGFAGDRLQSFEAAMVQHIRQQPIQTVLVVAGVAFLLGAIWRHR